MEISNRIQNLAKLILNKGDYCTIEELSEKLDVSQRTVYRELPDVERLMEKYGILLTTASKKGIRAEGRPGDLRKLRAALGEVEDVYIVDPKKRLDYILLYLIHEEDWIKMEAIAIDHQASLTTVRTDIGKARERLSGYDLRMVQKKGQGVRITGTRMEKNHLMTDLLLREVDETDMYHWLERGQGGADPFLARITEYGFADIVRRTYGSLQSVFARTPQTMREFKTRDYLEMVLLLSFMLYYHAAGQPYTEFLGASLEKEHEQELLRNTIEQLKLDFSVTFKESELTYLQWVIRVCLGSKQDAVTTVRNQSTNENIFRFTEYVEDRLGLYLTRDKELKEGLYAHMDKALLRIRSNMQIENPALSEIRRDYGELFAAVQDGVRSFFPKDYFPEDEIGYLVLYFAMTMEKMAQRIFRVLVVCSGGMGSSKMLAASIEREIPEIRVEKTLSVVALGNEKLGEYDLILSTIPLYLDDSEYLRVSPMLHRNEIALIREKVRRHKHSQIRRIDAQSQNIPLRDGNSEEILERTAKIGALSLEILRGFRIVPFTKSTEIQEDVRTSLEHILAFRGNGFDDAAVLIQSKSWFRLPTMNTLYYEGIADALKTPLIYGHSYREEGPENALAAVIVLFPDELEKYEKRLLQYLVESIIQDSEFAGYVESEETEEARRWVGCRCREYLKALLDALT